MSDTSLLFVLCVAFVTVFWVGGVHWFVPHPEPGFTESTETNPIQN